ncbi:MAG TPA: hypothetical protein VKR79_00240 [Gaiellaceae bacterium]|nr:hypothetical protein [Gaiellaceae bacterium]
MYSQAVQAFAGRVVEYKRTGWLYVGYSSHSVYSWWTAWPPGSQSQRRPKYTRPSTETVLLKLAANGTVQREQDQIRWRSPSGRRLTWTFLAWKQPGHNPQSWLYFTGGPLRPCYGKLTQASEIDGIWTTPGTAVLLGNGNFRPAETVGQTTTLTVSHSYAKGSAVERATLNADKARFETDTMLYRDTNGHALGADTLTFHYGDVGSFKPDTIPSDQVCTGAVKPS